MARNSKSRPEDLGGIQDRARWQFRLGERGCCYGVKHGNPMSNNTDP